MNEHDFDRYYEPAMDSIIGGKGSLGEPPSVHFKDRTNYFDKLLGINLAREYFSRPYKYDFPLSDELRNLLISLAGPHGKTILKVYRIQKGLDR